MELAAVRRRQSAAAALAAESTSWRSRASDTVRYVLFAEDGGQAWNLAADGLW